MASAFGGSLLGFESADRPDRAARSVTYPSPFFIGLPWAPGRVGGGPREPAGNVH